MPDPKANDLAPRSNLPGNGMTSAPSVPHTRTSTVKRMTHLDRTVANSVNEVVPRSMLPAQNAVAQQAANRVADRAKAIAAAVKRGAIRED